MGLLLLKNKPVGLAISYLHTSHRYSSWGLGRECVFQTPLYFSFPWVLTDLAMCCNLLEHSEAAETFRGSIFLKHKKINSIVQTVVILG